MPRYFFEIFRDGAPSPQTEGIELADNSAAWEEATTACGEMIRSMDGSLRPGAEWRMDVVDDNGKLLYRMQLTTTSFVG